jgi:hypothetical protein
MAREQSYKRWRAITTIKNNIDMLEDDYLFFIANKVLELRCEQESIIKYAFENKDKILKELKEKRGNYER